MSCTRIPAIALYAIILTAAISAAGVLAAAEAPQKVEARPRSIMPANWSFEIRTLKVSRGDMLPDESGNPQDKRFSLMGQGTELAIFLRAEGKTIVDVDTSGSTIDSFADDRGKDLLKGPDGKKPEGFFGGPIGHSEVAPSGSLAKIEFHAPGIPSTGAQKVEVKGTLKALTGSDPQTFVSKGVALKEGTKFYLGEIEFNVKEWKKGSLGFIGADESEKDIHTLTLATNSDIRKVKALEFLDAKGTPIKAREVGRGTMSLNELRSCEITWSFPSAGAR